MLNTFYIGIDVSKSYNSVYVMNSDGSKVFNSSFKNSASGSKQLLDKVRKLSNDAFFHFALESTGRYGEHLAMFLRESTDIPKNMKLVHILNAKQVKKFKDSYPEIPKNDKTDAFVIADCLRFGRIGQKGTIMDEIYYALMQLTRLRYQYSNDLAREKNRFLNTLFLKFSTLSQIQASNDKLFSNTFGNTCIELVNEYYSVDEIAYEDLDTLTNFIIEKSKNHFNDPLALSKEIKKAANSSYRLPKLVQESVNQALAFQTSTIKSFEKQLKELDKVIKSQVDSLDSYLILKSIPGVGPVYAAGILAEIGDINRFDNQAALAKYCGLAWNENQSGSFKADNTPGIQSGNRYLKYYLLEATNLIRLHEPELKAFYAKKYSETPKSPHKRALVLTARKLVRLIFSLLKNNRLYTKNY